MSGSAAEAFVTLRVIGAAPAPALASDRAGNSRGLRNSEAIGANNSGLHIIIYHPFYYTVQLLHITQPSLMVQVGASDAVAPAAVAVAADTANLMASFAGLERT